MTAKNMAIAKQILLLLKMGEDSIQYLASLQLLRGDFSALHDLAKGAMLITQYQGSVAIAEVWIFIDFTRGFMLR